MPSPLSLIIDLLNPRSFDPWSILDLPLMIGADYYLRFAEAMKRDGPHSIRVKATLDHLERLVNFVIDRARAGGVPEEKIGDLHLAVDEACANVIRYAYPPGEEGELELSCLPAPGRFAVSVRDWGRPFDPLSVPPPDLTLGLDQRPVGGLGIHFLRQVCDELSYCRREGCNLLLIAKKF